METMGAKQFGLTLVFCAAAFALAWTHRPEAMVFLALIAPSPLDARRGADALAGGVTSVMTPPDSQA